MLGSRHPFFGIAYLIMGIIDLFLVGRFACLGRTGDAMMCFAVGLIALLASFRLLSFVAIVAAVALFTSSSQAATCHYQNTFSQAGHYVAVPFALPVGVPVAVASPYWYGYQTAQSPAHLEVATPKPARGAAEEPVPAKQPLASAIAQHCVSCHSGAKAKAGLDLTQLSKLKPTQKLNAVRMVIGQQMPPAAEKQALPPADVGRIVEELTREPETNGAEDAKKE